MMFYLGSIKTSSLNFNVSSTVHVENMVTTSKRCINYLFMKWSVPHISLKSNIVLTSGDKIDNVEFITVENVGSESIVLLPSRMVMFPSQGRKLFKMPAGNHCTVFSVIFTMS